MEQALAAFASDPADEVLRLERQLNVAEDALQEAVKSEDLEEGRLGLLAAEGPYSVGAQLEEEAAGLEATIERERLRMEAIRLLRQTVVACREQAIASIAAPVERIATAMMHRIAGKRLVAIRFNPGFVPESVVPELADGAVALDAASGGEKEQIFLATRLALGELLAREERQSLVLDDVLVATDTGRLMRTLAVLEEAVDRLQIVILTCHPERYGGLSEASRFDLQEIVTERSVAAAAL